MNRRDMLEAIAIIAGVSAWLDLLAACWLPGWPHLLATALLLALTAVTAYGLTLDDQRK